MPMVRAMRMLNAVEAGTLSGAQLEALLIADPGRLAELNVLLGMRGQTRRIVASSTAMTAVAASSTAMTAVAASSTAMTAVVASSTAMTAVDASDQALRIWTLAGTNQVWSNFANFTAVAASSTAMTAVAASSTAMTAVAASSTARAAIYNSDTALEAIAASTTAIAAIAASAGYQTKTGINSAPSAASIGFTGPAIIIKLSQSWSSNADSNMIIGNLRAGTAISGTKNNGPAPGTYNATAGVPGNTWVLPAQATATQSNTAGSIGAVLNIGFIYV